jgi:hypothetical protein
VCPAHLVLYLCIMNKNHNILSEYCKCKAGLSLIEVMVTILIMVLTLLGASGFRYYAALDTQRADVEITAARLGSMFLNNWNATGSDSTQLGQGLEIYENAPGAAVPDGFSELDASNNPNFRIVVNNVNYYATLSYKDQTNQPRTLNVCVAWMDDYQLWDESETSRSVNFTGYADE